MDRNDACVLPFRIGQECRVHTPDVVRDFLGHGLYLYS